MFYTNLEMDLHQIFIRESRALQTDAQQLATRMCRMLILKL
jgi:hypothetical protein